MDGKFAHIFIHFILLCWYLIDTWSTLDASFVYGGPSLERCFWIHKPFLFLGAWDSAGTRNMQKKQQTWTGPSNNPLAAISILFPPQVIYSVDQAKAEVSLVLVRVATQVCPCDAGWGGAQRTGSSCSIQVVQVVQIVQVAGLCSWVPGSTNCKGKINL